MKFKWLSMLMAAVISTGLIAGCSSNSPEAAEGNETPAAAASDNLNETGFPIVKEPIQLAMMTSKAPTTANNWNETMLWQEYAKMTNINVDFQLVASDAMAEKRNLAMASGEYPDAFFIGGWSTNDLMKYGGQGSFIPLNDLIDKYAPNLKAIMDQYPEVRKALTMPDGNIYSMPNMFDPEFTSVRMGGKLFLKQEWLDALGMAEPATTEEFYNFLVAVKNTDLNKNGQQDEIPIGSTTLATLVNHFKGAFGLGNRGTAHAMVDMGDNNELRFIPTDERYKEFLEYFNKLWTEGLIDPDILVNEKEQNKFYAKGAEGVYGAIKITSPFTLMNQTGYIGAPAMEGPRGDKLYSEFRPPVAGPGAFVITDKNKYPAETVRWMDYFYGEEGNKMFFMGFKDKSYIENADGTVEYTDEILKNPDGLTFEQALVKYVTWPGGGYPGIVRAKFFKGAEGLPESLEAAEKAEAYIPEEIWPTFTFTEEESATMDALSTDITTYVNEMRTKFITGDTPMTEWDNYVKTIEQMGLKDYMEIYKAAYERYQQQ